MVRERKKKNAQEQRGVGETKKVRSTKKDLSPGWRRKRKRPPLGGGGGGGGEKGSLASITDGRPREEEIEPKRRVD